LAVADEKVPLAGDGLWPFPLPELPLLPLIDPELVLLLAVPVDAGLVWAPVGHSPHWKALFCPSS